MGKQPKRRVVLNDYKAKAKDRSIDIEGEDGRTYSALPPDLWPDAVFTLLAKEDLIGVGAMLLGDEYEAFVTTGGGSAAMLMAIIKDQEGADLGESGAS